MSNIFEIFTGELVRITLSKDETQTVQLPTGYKTLSSTFLVDCYIIDEDDDFLYVGLTEKVINRAISKDQITMVEKLDQNEIERERLNEIVDYPETEDGFN